MAYSKTLGFTALSLVCLLVVISSADFDRTQTVRGKLWVDRTEANLYITEPGLITRLAIQHGDRVETGDMIAEITTDQPVNDSEAPITITLSELQEEKAMLHTRREILEEASSEAEQEAWHRYDAATRQEHDLRQQLDAARERLSDAETRAADARAVPDKSRNGEPERNQHLDAAAPLKRNLLQIESQIGDAQSRQRRAEQEVDQIRATLDRDLTAIDTSLIGIELKIDLVRSQSAYRIYAPIAGHVAGLKVGEGERALKGQSLAVIRPDATIMMAELYVPSRAIGLIQPGQQVKLRYDAYPYQKFGTAIAQITHVPDFGQRPDELDVSSQTGELLYRVEVTLNAQTHEAYGQDMPLQAGMELSAILVLEDRKIIEWFLDPLRTGRAAIEPGHPNSLLKFLWRA